MENIRGYSRKKQTAALAVNLAVVALEVVGAALMSRESGLGMFWFYTVDSNLLAMLACAVCAFFEARGLVRGEPMPPFAKTLKYVAASCLALTFAVVICVLVPMSGPHALEYALLRGSMLYHHLLCPIGVIASYALLEREPPLKRGSMIWALLPTAAYAAVTVACNAAGVLEGPYPFLRVNEQPLYMTAVWAVVILGGALLLAWAVSMAGRARRSKNS